MNEAQYHTAWKTLDKSLEPKNLALEAGALTVEPAFIFIAGYQAAIRATFPEITHNKWVAYAASEDRNPENYRPGVKISLNRLSGFKTWVAMSAVVDQLIIKAGTGAEAKYLLVERENPALAITHKENVNFLAPMSQGVVEFNDAEFTELKDASLVKQFTQNEPLYIYLALLGSLKAHYPALTSSTQLIEQSDSLSLIDLDQRIQNILEVLAHEKINLGNNWNTDKRLFSMYSKGIQTRA